MRNSAIRKLPDILISRIAAGEVVERPASVVKELVENSIDAQSTKIDISIVNGGKSLILIEDNGHGIERDQLELALLRHATSKIEGSDLLNINSLGFRGEGLASIASVSKLILNSKHQDSEEAWKISNEPEQENEIIPSNLQQTGTSISVENLFYLTPARLKFLKADSYELAQITDIVKKISLMYPDITFSLKNNGKQILNFESDIEHSLKERINQVIGMDFFENSSQVQYQDDITQITGYAAVPTYNKSSNKYSYIFLNGRYIKDKNINIAIRLAYQDYLAKDRYPATILFIKINNQEVDVNVHPTKSEVRFRDNNHIKMAVIKALKDTLHKNNQHVSTTLDQEIYNKLNDNLKNQETPQTYVRHDYTQKSMSAMPRKYQENYHQINKPPSSFTQKNQDYTPKELVNHIAPEPIKNKDEIFDPEYYLPLGIAKCQVNKTYIISQNQEGLILIDQHAAHERVIYEKMKKSLENSLEISTQHLLIPEIIEIESSVALEKILQEKEELNKIGIKIKKFGVNAIEIIGISSYFSNIDSRKLLLDLIDNIEEYQICDGITTKLNFIFATLACHNSIRAGKILSLEQMNHLLREMEKTEFSGQCNHGRPTYVHLTIKDLAKLFDR